MIAQKVAVGSGAAFGAVAIAAVVAWFYVPHGSPGPSAPISVSSAPDAMPKLGAPAATPAAPGASASASAPQPAARPAATAATLPQFDVVRVERSGDAVIAGRAAPNSTVGLTAGGKVVAEAKVDANGNFVLVPSLPQGAYDLGLRMTTPGAPAVASTQSVTVSVPAKGDKGVVVALSEPGKPTKLLADPTAAAGGAKPAPPVAVKTAEVQQGGGFLASGTAPPGAHIRLYLNDSPLTDVTAAPDGAWSVTIGKGMTPGHYAVRADALDAAGKVVARAEVPFEAPAMPKVASTTELASAAPAQTQRPAGSQASAAVVPEIQTATVVHGDSLWVISRKILGSGIRYTQIYAANSNQIRNPDLIYPGQIFVMPGHKE